MIAVDIINYNNVRRFYLVVLLSFVTINFCNAQFNLVNNPSFEQYDICPNALNGLVNPKFWYQPSNQAGVYSNACSNDTCFKVPYNCVKSYNYQPAHSGGALVYLDYKNSLNERTYLQSELKDSLRAGHYYYVSFFVNLPNTLRYGCNNNGLLFTNTAVYVDTNNYTYGVLPANPQIVSYGNPIIIDTCGWQKISSVYVAQGGEKFITIGNFKYDSQTVFKSVNPTGYFSAGYMIDDVFVIPLDSMQLQANAGKDTTITQGDSVFIGSLINGITNITWYNNAKTVINTAVPGFYVHPTSNTFYVVEQTVGGYHSSDTVYISVNPLPLRFTNYELRFTNETRNGINKKQVTSNWTTSNEINVSHFNVQRSISEGGDFKTIGLVKANGNGEYSFLDMLNILPPSPLGEGLGTRLYYKIEAVDRDGKKQYSEIRNIKLEISNGISLFPNPAKNVLHISSTENLKELQIINELGQVVQQINNINHTSYSIQLTSYTKGLYVLKTITNNNVIRFEKFIKQ